MIRLTDMIEAGQVVLAVYLSVGFAKWVLDESLL